MGADLAYRFPVLDIGEADSLVPGSVCFLVFNRGRICVSKTRRSGWVSVVTSEAASPPPHTIADPDFPGKRHCCVVFLGLTRVKLTAGEETVEGRKTLCWRRRMCDDSGTFLEIAIERVVGPGFVQVFVQVFFSHRLDMLENAAEQQNSTVVTDWTPDLKSIAFLHANGKLMTTVVSGSNMKNFSAADAIDVCVLSRGKRYDTPDEDLNDAKIDLLFPNGGNRTVAVFGALGCGKSTWLKSTMCRFARGELWKDRFATCVKIPLGSVEARVAKMNCRDDEDIWKAALAVGLAGTKVDLVKFWEWAQEKKGLVLFAFDSADEVSRKCQRVINFVSGKGFCVLFAARPQVETIHYDWCISVKGFSLVCYVHRFFGSVLTTEALELVQLAENMAPSLGQLEIMKGGRKFLTRNCRPFSEC
jgi:hypothetical protein